MDKLDEMQTLTEKEYHDQTPSETFNFWLYENYLIDNSNDYIKLAEDTEVQLKFLRDVGLPEDTEL